MKTDSSDQYEQHPLLPSGYWVGFYVYQRKTEKHEMQIMIDFENGSISGSGQDDIGAFTFKGSYDLKSMSCSFIKYYSSHTIDYSGQIDENGIWGKWTYPYDKKLEVIRKHRPELLSGGFHIWPKNKAFSEYEMEVRKIKEEEVVKQVQ